MILDASHLWINWKSPAPAGYYQPSSMEEAWELIIRGHVRHVAFAVHNGALLETDQSLNLARLIRKYVYKLPPISWQIFGLSEDPVEYACIDITMNEAHSKWIVIAMEHRCNA